MAENLREARRTHDLEKIRMRDKGETRAHREKHKTEERHPRAKESNAGENQKCRKEFKAEWKEERHKLSGDIENGQGGRKSDRRNNESNKREGMEERSLTVLSNEMQRCEKIEQEK